MLGITLQNRYHIESELGRGGMGTVYRAHDILLDRPVAVKVLNDSGLGTEGRARLLREAQSVARLDHPSIVAVHDAGETESTPYIVMQLVEGESLHARRPTALAEILAIARQICAALDHAHAHGIIHRDLKPENVIVTPDGSAKLMDFGLAHSTASRLTNEGAFVGTVFYLAPEQALGREIDHRVDLYSLGVVLYELAAGRLPFVADDPVAVISQHLHAPVVPPSTYNPDVSPALDALIVTLMAKDPAQRFASAMEAREAIDNLDGAATAVQATLEVSPIERIVRGRLVAREQELAAASDHWRRAVAGEGGALLISGEPGIGKTCLVRELVTLAEVAGGKALVGECYAEGSAPYAPIAQIIQTAFADSNERAFPLPPRAPASLRDLPPLILADLITLTPALRARYPDAPPNPPLDPQAEQQRLFESVVAFCAALAARTPLLMVVDDAHWADGGTLFLLRHLARRIRKQRLLLVLTYREVELDEARALNEVLADLNRERLAARVKLARLNKDQTRDLLAAMFQREITPEFLESLYHETEGNPFFVEEVCKALIEEGQLFHKDGRWHRTLSMEQIQVPQSVRVAIQARVGKLAAQTQDVLRLAAILGREFEFGTLHRATELNEDTLVEALEIAERAQLIGEVRRVGRETYAFAHALIPATLREGVSGVRRHRLHRRAAAAVEAVHADDYEVLAYHWAEAGDEERALDYYTRAADRARKLYANEDALRFYAEALALISEDHPQRFDLLAARVKVYDIVARREQQRADIDAMLALAEKQNDDARRCDVLIALADFYIATEVARAEQPAQRAVDIARRLGDRAREGHGLRRAGHAAWAMAKWVESRPLLEASVACFREADLPEELPASLSLLSLALRDLLEFSAAQTALEEVVALSRQIGDKSQEGAALRRLAYLRLWRDNDAEAALPLARAALALHQATGNRWEESNSHNALAVVCEALKQWETAEEHYRQFLEISEAIENNGGIREAVMRLGLLRLEHGEYEAVLKLTDEYLSRARQSGDGVFINEVQSQKVLPLRALGQFQAALEAAETYASFAEKSLGQSVQGFALLEVAIVQAELGRYAQARETFAHAWEKLTQPGIPARERSGVLVWRGYLGWLENTEDSLHAGLEDAGRAVTLLVDVEHAFFYWLAYARLISARIHLALSAPEAALAASGEALRVWMTHYPSSFDSERYYLTHSRALRAVGRAAEADEYLKKAYERVMLVASNTKDETLRRSWLENVRDNREIVREFESLKH